ncbi:MAG: CDP-alcohol phosphatidyltransferase family protein [Actinomycetota bacterium]
MTSQRQQAGASTAILTVPNVISAIRIALIPVFVVLLLGDGTEWAGVLLFAIVAASDWVDGFIARRTGSVSELGKVLDPVADRLAIGAGLIALVVADAFPLWAALLILVRDVAVFVVGLVLLTRSRVRIDVRYIGKVATFGLMTSVTCIAWGSFDLPLAGAATAVGWIAYAVAIVEYYVATVLYARDVREARATPGSLDAA